MWIYRQSTGELSYWTPPHEHGASVIVAHGYSGHAEGRNNPTLQSQHETGPIPEGFYTLGPARDTLTHGPVVMRLEPSELNRMFGRDGFLVHGDNSRHDASLGCIILDRDTRLKMAESDDRLLSVVA